MKTEVAVAGGGIGIVAVVGVLGLLLGFKFPIPQKADITLTLSESANNIAITGSTGNHHKCKNPASVGCVHVSWWRKAKITFGLTGLENEDWKFTKMQLVAESTTNPDKLDFNPQTGFSPEMMEDFYVKVNGVEIHPNINGIIDLSGLSKGREFRLVDENKVTQDYFYQIEACNGVCKMTDPKIENEGDN
jgi:hypothetical protein